MKSSRLHALIAATVLLTTTLTGRAQSTAFTYQGRLTDSDGVVTGLHDFEFRLFNAATGGAQQGPTVMFDDLGVTNGLFTVTLDFGANFPGADRFLQIAVRPGASTGAYTPLNPRQAITAAPYAVFAVNAGTAVTANSVLGLTLNTNLSSVAMGTGNAAIASFSTVSGGTANTANAAYATVGGGSDNTATGQRATVGGGYFNLATGDRSVVAGGYGNEVSGYAAVLGGGLGNRVGGNYATLGGGDNNRVSGGGAFVGGGSANQATNGYATVPGGENNLAGGQYSFAAGQRAKARHDGAFVWADSQNADFSSTANNQFSIRAGGGLFLDGKLGVGLPSPDYPLDVQAAQAVGRFTSTNNAYGAVLSLRNTSPSSTYLGAINFENANGTPGQISYLASDAMSFRVGGSEPVSISANGLSVNGTADVISLSALEASVAYLTSTDLLQIRASAQSENHTFTGDLRQMLSLAPGSLFGPDGPGLGLQTNNLYFRSQSDFSWFRRGTHRDTPYDPGASFFESGAELMRLSGGYLTVRGEGGEQVYLGGDGAGGDIEIGSRNAGVMNVGFWNPAVGQHMNVFARTFNPTSDRNAKQDFAPVDPAAILAKVVALPITEWAYKGEAATRHLGPVAQDFKEAFRVGGSDKSIATVDADGVALAAIQGLNQKLEAEVKSKDVRIAELEQRLSAIEALLQK